MSDQNQIPVPTIEGFKKWLSEQPETDIVGFSCTAFNCPLLNYLKTLSEHFIGVAGVYYRYRKENINLEIDTERWMRKFIIRIDNFQGVGDAVSAKQALEILNEVTA